MSRISKALITVAVIAALTGITEWLLGPPVTFFVARSCCRPGILSHVHHRRRLCRQRMGWATSSKDGDLSGRAPPRQKSSQKTYGPPSRKVASTQDQVSTKGNGVIQSRNTPKLNPQGCQ